MADDIITRDDNGDLAVNVVVSTEANVPYNYDDCFTLDTNNRRALRVVGAGGGDSHNKGYFATQAALEEAYPTGEAGDYAIVGATDTVWLWDEDNSEWIDSDQKGQVTSVNGQTGAVTVSEVPSQTGYSGRVLGTDGFVAGWVVPEKVQRSTMPQASEEEVNNIYQYVGTTDANYTNGYFYKCISDGQDPATYSWTRVDVQPAPVIPDPLPSQTGQSGKFLTTDGTNASWSDKAVVNNTTEPYSIAIGGNSVCEDQNSVAIGANARAVGSYNVAIGSGAGNSSSSGQAGQIQIAIGYYAKTRAYGAIQLGMGTNRDTNTFKVGNDNGNFEIMSADGTIPADRLVHAINWYSTMPTASADNFGDIIQFTGATDANYTNGYFYECVVDSTTPALATIAQTTGNTLSDLTVDGETFWEKLGDYSIPQQTGDYAFTYNEGIEGWEFDNNYFDLEAEFGVTYTGTPADGDVLTISVTAPSATYTWTRIDVQPSSGGGGLPSQTGNAGKFLTTDGTDASWSDKPLVNSAVNSGSLNIGGDESGIASPASNNTLVGKNTSMNNFCGYTTVVGDGANGATAGVFIGCQSFGTSSGLYGTAIGYQAGVDGQRAIQLGAGQTNSDANTFKVANANGNFEIMSADGTVPTDRLTHAINKYSTMPTAASTNEGWIVQFTGTTDSTYTHGHLYECVSDGADPATYSWTEVQLGGGSSYTAGTGIDITNDVISVTAPTLTNNENSVYSLGLLENATASNNGVAVGWLANAGGGVAVGESSQSSGGFAGGALCRATGTNAVALGCDAIASGTSSIQINTAIGVSATNSDANTFKVANANGNFEMMNANGNLPADRLASTTGLADGNYRLRLTITNGEPTLSWVAE